jgi:uncharacterized protein Usg
MLILRNISRRTRQEGMMANLSVQLHDYRLTTAEILYYMPDHPDLLQSFIWQEYDLAPRFPGLHKFLDFWAHEIHGKLHSVRLASQGLISNAELRIVDGEFTIH